MREDIIKEAEAELDERRLRNERESERRRAEIRESAPELSGLMAEREELIFGSIRGILGGRGTAEDLPGQMERISRRIREGLKERGYPENYLEPVFGCEICRDTGYTGETVKSMCTCLEAILRKKMRESIGLDIGGESFEKYDESLFGTEPLEGYAISQREINALVRDNCIQWVDKWPNQKPRDLVLSGPSGVGKTWMLRAMANRLTGRGCEVLPITAFRFLEIARKSYFDGEEGMEVLLSTPILMLDDLGSEPLMKNITIEMLFQLVNTRQSRNLATIISTNLNESELKDRYSERIVSRLTDRRSCSFIRMEGRDVRTGR